MTLTLKRQKLVKVLPTASTKLQAGREAGFMGSDQNAVNGVNLALKNPEVQQALLAEAKALGLDQPDLERELAKAALVDPDDKITWSHKLEALKQVAKLRKYIDAPVQPSQGDTYNQVVLQGYTLEQLRSLLQGMQQGHALPPPTPGVNDDSSPLGA